MPCKALKGKLYFALKLVIRNGIKKIWLKVER
jgi:hypothetical protein